MALLQKTALKGVGAQRQALLPARPALSAPVRRSTLLRAEPEAKAPEAKAPSGEPYTKPGTNPPPASSSSSDSTDQLTKQAEELLAKAQAKWEDTPDSEKPAAIAIVIAAVVAQVAIGASVEAVERIPFISTFLEVVGLVVTSVYVYRYATDPAEREGVQNSLDNFTKAVTGKKV